MIASSDIHGTMVRITRFRNRLAHNEPIFSSRTGLVTRLAEVTHLFCLLAPQAAAWTARGSPLPRLIAACPVDGLIAHRLQNNC